MRRTLEFRWRTLNRSGDERDYVSDNRETVLDVKASCMHVDTVFHCDESDDKEKFCDEKSGLIACSRGR